MDKGEIQFLIILVSLSFLSILLLLASLMFYLSKKKVQFVMEKERSKMAFEEQLLRTEIEITEQNLRNISWELHDNIGQLMSVAAIEIELLTAKAEPLKAELREVSGIIKSCMDQIRGISKTLNRDMVLKVGLYNALKNEVDRIGRLGLQQVEFECPENIALDDKYEIILFRMIQEFISNTLKHANSENLSIKIVENGNLLEVFAADDGVGFAKDDQQQGLGMINLEQRAKLMNAKLTIKSLPHIGTEMILIIPIIKPNYEK